jgi:hypothetical protein
MALREMASNEETEPSEVTQNVIFSKDGEEKLNEEQIENENQTEVKNDEDKYDYDLICRWMSKSTTQTYYYFDFNAGIVTELSITTKKGSTDVKSVEGPKTGELSGNMQNGWTYGMYEFRCEERNGENRVIMYVNGNEHADCYIVDNELGLDILDNYKE